MPDDVCPIAGVHMAQSIQQFSVSQQTCKMNVQPTATVSENLQQLLFRKSIAVTAAIMSAKFSVSTVCVKSLLFDRTSQISHSTTTRSTTSGQVTDSKGFASQPSRQIYAAGRLLLHVICIIDIRAGLDGRGRIRCRAVTSRNVYVSFSDEE